MINTKPLTPAERFSLLVKESEKKGLPKYYKGDLEYDKDIIEKYDGCSFLWVLREAGTNMIPLKKGVEPVHVTYYITDPTALFYVVGLSGIRQITAQELEKLAYELPLNLNAYSTAESLVEAVNAVIEQGDDYGWWDKQLGWTGLKAEFTRSNNQVMSEFLDKAFELKNKLTHNKQQPVQWSA